MAQIKVAGMSCQHCVKSVTEALEKIDGVTNVKVTLETGVAEYETEKDIPPNVIKDAIEKIGFKLGL